MPAVAAIILAAGSSSRLGFPKQAALLGRETLLARATRIALEAGLKPIYEVTSPRTTAQVPSSNTIQVINHQAGEGMASSICAGILALTGSSIPCTGTIILACDQPAVTPQHLHALALGGTEIVASAYAGRRGIPAYFPSGAFPALRSLHGDIGARDLLLHAKAIPLLGGELDIDTIEDLVHARALYST